MIESAKPTERSVPRFLAFGDWVADLEAGEIRSARGRVRLQKKPFRLLAGMLVRALDGPPHHVFDRAELWKLVWPEFPLDGNDLTISEANNVNTAIRKIRLAFGDGFIETIRGFGYRYAGPEVRVISNGDVGVKTPGAGGPSRAAVAAIAVIVFALGTLAAWFLWPRPQPRTAAVEGEYIVARDAAGEELWAYPVERDAAFRYENPAGQQGRVILVEDLEGDGSTEVVVSWREADILNQRGAIACFDRNGTRRWVTPVGRPLRLGMREFRDAFTPWILGVAESRRGPALAINSHQDPYFPAQILFLDVETGEPIGEYLHPGHVYAHAIKDLDEDGVSEVVVAGINNPGDGFGYPFVALLSPDPISDPPRPGPFSYPETHLREYLLFPRPSLFDAVGERVQVRNISIDDKGSVLMRFGIDEVLVSMTTDLRPLGAQAGDRFRERFFAEFGRYPDPEEVDAWSRPVRFQTTPLGNSDEVRRLMEP